jgi:hypothetical protein
MVVETPDVKGGIVLGALSSEMLVFRKPRRHARFPA